MPKETATDKTLAILHQKTAKAMLDALESSETAQALLDQSYEDDDGNEMFIPALVREYLKKQASASPALLTAITKFLKDNDITCQIDETEEMSALQQRLAAKPRKSVALVKPE